MQAKPTIRPFREDDSNAVIALFKKVNRQIAPPSQRDAFESYIASSVEQEMGRIEDYYAERDGGFWVAVTENAPDNAPGNDLEDEQLVGMFGLETASGTAMELRRMYVNPSWRRRGVARQLLDFAKGECLKRGKGVLELSTSELQGAALQLYRNAGFDLVSEAVADQASNKTIGGGIRRYHFEMKLKPTCVSR